MIPADLRTAVGPLLCPPGRQGRCRAPGEHIVEEEVQAGGSPPSCSKPGQPIALRFEKQGIITSRCRKLVSRSTGLHTPDAFRTIHIHMHLLSMIHVGIFHFEFSHY